MVGITLPAMRHLVIGELLHLAVTGDVYFRNIKQSQKDMIPRQNLIDCLYIKQTLFVPNISLKMIHYLFSNLDNRQINRGKHQPPFLPCPISS